jgi:transglutaminase-like putative cysteine protease
MRVLEAIRRVVVMIAVVAPWGLVAYFASHANDRPTPLAASAEMAGLSSQIGAIPEHATFSDTPSFVVEVGPVSPENYQFEAEGGVHYVLVDQQHDARPDQPVWYNHYISQPVTTAGVSSAASWNVSYDPTFETLAYHTIRVSRDAATQDRRQTASIDFARRETRLERQMFDGRVTAILRLDDIRVGDIVEVAYSITGKNPALDDQDSRSASLGFSAPVEQLYFRSAWRSDAGARQTITGPEPENAVIVENINGTTSFTYGPVGVSAFVGESGAPAWIEQTPRIRVTNFDGWAGVAAWSEPLYGVSSSEAVLEISNQIRSDHSSDEARLIAALRFTQDEIRYMATSFGSSGYVPEAPELTLQRRYGDCKAKTVLLLSLLTALDIEADAALVNTSRGRGLDLTQPSHIAFNHVLVRARLAGDDYWIDGTRAEQGGSLEFINQSALGMALPLDGQTRRLVEMGDAALTGPASHIVEEYVLSDDHESAVLNWTLSSDSYRADQLRSIIARSGRSQIEESLTESYNRVFGTVEVLEPLNVVDNREINQIVMTMQLNMEQVLGLNEDGIGRELRGTAPLRTVVTSSAERDRDYPLGLAFPMRESAEIIIRIPGSTDSWSISTPDRNISSDAFDYTVSTSETERELRLSYSLIVNAPTIASEHAPAALASVAQIRRLNRWVVSAPGQASE